MMATKLAPSIRTPAPMGADVRRRATETVRQSKAPSSQAPTSSIAGLSPIDPESKIKSAPAAARRKHQIPHVQPRTKARRGILGAIGASLVSIAHRS